MKLRGVMFKGKLGMTLVIFLAMGFGASTSYANGSHACDYELGLLNGAFSHAIDKSWTRNKLIKKVDDADMKMDQEKCDDAHVKITSVQNKLQSLSDSGKESNALDAMDEALVADACIIGTASSLCDGDGGSSGGSGGHPHGGPPGRN